jgi:hypothetical protein
VTRTAEKIIIANMSGFYGDRFSAAREMVQDGPVDVLTGDYLAELTMAILYKAKAADPAAGYAVTFLQQMEEILGICLDRGITVVANAGGLNPAGLAADLNTVAARAGLAPRIAWIEGDNLIDRLPALERDGEPFLHLDRGVPRRDAGMRPITANAYLGCWGVVEALERGADIVVTGRIADAALVMGPAARHFGWRRTDWNCLAGAAAAGHVIECGTQATGGNYAFFSEVPDFHRVGFPLAEIHSDGSAVITKHPGTGGLVSVGTVTAQLMYEIEGPGYLTPDVTARFDTISLTAQGPDRVLLAGVRGEPPTDTAKVCINNLAGFRNSMTVVLTGLDIDRKAAVVRESFLDAIGGDDKFERLDIKLIRSGRDDPQMNEEAFSFLRISVGDSDRSKAGKFFSRRIIELALANIPGFHVTTPPTEAQPAIVHWPALIHKKHLQQMVHLGDEVFPVVETMGAVPERTTARVVHAVGDASGGENAKIGRAGGTGTRETVVLRDPIADVHAVSSAVEDVSACAGRAAGGHAGTGEDAPGPVVRLPLGRIFGTRSGDKGGNANLGVWCRCPAAYPFLRDWLTVATLRELFPDLAPYEIDRYEFPNLAAVNFFIRGFLGDGVAASIKADPQAKTLGEYVRAKMIDIPQVIAVYT